METIKPFDDHYKKTKKIFEFKIYKKTKKRFEFKIHGKEKMKGKQ